MPLVQDSGVYTVHTHGITYLELVNFCVNTRTFSFCQFGKLKIAFNIIIIMVVEKYGLCFPKNLFEFLETEM